MWKVDDIELARSGHDLIRVIGQREYEYNLDYNRVDVREMVDIVWLKLSGLTILTIFDCNILFCMSDYHAIR